MKNDHYETPVIGKVMVPCRFCGGAGLLSRKKHRDDRYCPACGGAGSVPVYPDKHGDGCECAACNGTGSEKINWRRKCRCSVCNGTGWAGCD